MEARRGAIPQGRCRQGASSTTVIPAGLSARAPVERPLGVRIVMGGDWLGRDDWPCSRTMGQALPAPFVQWIGSAGAASSLLLASSRGSPAADRGPSAPGVIRCDILT